MSIYEQPPQPHPDLDTGDGIEPDATTVSNPGVAGAVPQFAPQMEAEIQHQVDHQSHILNVALNSIQDFAYIFDRSGRFIYSNQALLRLLGITLTEIIGKDFFDLNYPPDLATRLQRQIQQVFDTGKIVTDETPYVSPTGVDGFYEYIFTPVFAADGTVESVAGSTRDITRRVKAEQERERLVQQLGAEQAKLHYLFDKAPAFVATLTGPQHIFELTNPAYRQLIGHRDLIGKPVREALPEIEGQGFFELLDKVFETGESFTGKELAVQLQRESEGLLEERLVNFVYQPVFDADGKVGGIFAHGIDITEQVHARKAAETANRAKDEFLATLSHELRSPLAAIVGWTHILQSGHNSPEEVTLGLTTIARNARSQGQLIDDILDVSRMIAGKMRLELQSLNLRDIMEEALSAILPTAQAKHIDCQPIFDEGESIVSGDPVRLQQVLRNLLSNALKFTPEGGWVQVRLERTTCHAEITVADSGIGIASNMLPHVFERFRQVDSTTTRAQSGLGLGLAIVRHLVELHGGSVHAASAGLGQGATFTLRLPLVAAHASSAPDDGDRPVNREAEDRLVPSNTPRLDGLHVLVVDDGEDLRRFVAAVLQRSGARVTAVKSAPEAFKAIQEVFPDVLLSDIGMPGEDGFSLIKRVRALPRDNGGQIPAIALTAFVRLEDRAEVLNSGFQAHLAKPIDPVALIDTIDTLARGQATA